MNGCNKSLAAGQWWGYCGETDMGQTLPALCTHCGGRYILEEDMPKYDADYWIKCLRDYGWVGTPLINRQIANELEKLSKENKNLRIAKKRLIREHRKGVEREKKLMAKLEQQENPEGIKPRLTIKGLFRK